MRGGSLIAVNNEEMVCAWGAFCRDQNSSRESHRLRTDAQVRQAAAQPEVKVRGAGIQSTRGLEETRGEVRKEWGCVQTHIAKSESREQQHPCASYCPNDRVSRWC